MQERDSNPKDNFVMSGKKTEAEDGEESYGYAPAEHSGRQKSIKPVLIAGGILLVAVIVILMFLSTTPKSGEKDQIKGIETRLKGIEEKLAKLEWIDTGMARLDRKEKEIASISERMTQLEATVTKKVDQLSKDMTKPPPKPPESPPAPKPESAPHKAEAAAPKAAAPAKVEKEPKGKIHVVQKGETLYGISRKYGIPAEQVMKLNKLGPKDFIQPGQQLVLGPGKAG